MSDWMSTGAVAVMASIAWMPGVSPTPYEAPEAEAFVPSWVTPGDCDEVSEAPTAMEARQQLDTLLGCPRHVPGQVDGLLGRYQLARDAMQVDDPGAAVDAWALAVRWRDGSLLHQMVSLAIVEEAVTRLEQADDVAAYGERMVELRAATGPLHLQGERQATRSMLARTDELSMVDRLVLPALVAETDARAERLDPILAGPRGGRLARVRAAVDDDGGWRWAGPAAVLVPDGRRSWWARTAGHVLLEAVELDEELSDRVDALIARARPRPPRRGAPRPRCGRSR
jgi:hypothetical protein